MFLLSSGWCFNGSDKTMFFLGKWFASKVSFKQLLFSRCLQKFIKRKDLAKVHRSVCLFDCMIVRQCWIILSTTCLITFYLICVFTKALRAPPARLAEHPPEQSSPMQSAAARQAPHSSQHFIFSNEANSGKHLCPAWSSFCSLRWFPKSPKF